MGTRQQVVKSVYPKKLSVDPKREECWNDLDLGKYESLGQALEMFIQAQAGGGWLEASNSWSLGKDAPIMETGDTRLSLADAIIHTNSGQ